MSRRALAGCLLLLGVLLGLVLPAGALATPSSVPVGYVTNGPVSALAQSGGTLYLGGAFSQVGPRTGAFVGVSSVSGQASAPYPDVTGTVQAMVGDGSGGYFIGGSFTAVKGTPINNAAHIRADGTLDTGWKPNPDNVVYALAVSGSTVYLGGNFSHVTDSTGTGTVTRNNAAAVDATTGHDTAWNPNPDNAVLALAVSGSTVYLGGQFSQVTNSTGTGTVTRKNAAAVDTTTGHDTGWNPNPNNYVDALAVSGSTVYLGGYFDLVTNSTGTGTVTRNSAAAVDATTGQDTGWNPNPNNYVFALAVSGSTVYLGGQFSHVTDSTGTGTVTRNSAAAVDATTGHDTGWNPNPDSAVSALAVSGSTVYLGGNFSHVTDSTGTTTVTRNDAAGVDATTGHDTGWNPNPNSYVDALAVSGSTVYLGGSFDSVNGVARRNAAAFDSSGVVTGWNPNPDAIVSALAVSGSTVYLGGQFGQVTDSTGTTTVTRNNAAAVDATTGRDTGWNPNPDAGVTTLAVSGSTVYLGGYFSQVTDSTGTTTVTRNYAAAVDATTGHDTGWKPNPDSSVSALAVSGSTVYLAGYFSQVTDSTGATTVTRHFAAAVDATTGHDTGWNPNPSDRVVALAVAGSTVYLGGLFSQVTDSTGTTTVTRNYAAAVDATTGHDTGWNPNPDNAVYALAVSGSTVYLGGVFSQVTDSTGTTTVTRHNAAAVDATTGHDAGWDPNPDSVVQALAASSSTVYLGGTFDTVGLLPQSYVAEFQTPAPTPPSALATIPTSPGQSTTPQVTGTAEAGSTVNVYTTADCSGTAVASGSAANFGSPGLTVTPVATGSTTTYYASATDQAGNTSACSTAHAAYRQQSSSPPPADTTAPTVTVVSPTAPAGQDGYFNAANVNAAGGKITAHVTASDASGVTNLACTDSGHPIALTAQAGSGPRTATLTLSANGTHQLACVASDGATPANSGAGLGSHPTATVKIDTTIPTASTSTLARYQRQHAITVKWGGRDTGSGVVSYDLRERQVKINSTRYGGYTTIRRADRNPAALLTGTPGDTACFSTRTRDRAGNVSLYSAEQCTTSPLDERSLTRHGKWKPIGRTGYYAGSILRSTTPGATLTSPTITGQQIALLVTAQPHGGTIRITWHGHTHTISLNTRHTELRHVITLPGITGTGRLQITTGAGTTEIDALAAYKHP